MRNRENLCMICQVKRFRKWLTEDTQKNLEGKGTGDGEQKEEQGKITSSKFSDPKEFAAYLGIPFSSLQMLMKDHKERDPMVQ